jgi:hypothetical protein
MGKRPSYLQITNRWRQEYELVESSYLYEVFTDGHEFFINWLGTTLAGQRKLYAREWGEDYLALHRMIPDAWIRRIAHIYHRYGNDRNGVTHVGYSRGGGIAAFFGGAGYGAMTVKGLKIKKGARLYQVAPGDFIHYGLGIFDPYGRFPMFKNTTRDPAFDMFGPRQRTGLGPQPSRLLK